MTGLLLIEVSLAAFGVAVNPPAIIASIVLVASSRRAAIAFGGGWLVGLALVAAAVALLGDVTERLGGPSVFGMVMKLAVGVTLVVLAVGQWRKQVASSRDATMPRWMDSLTGLSAPRAFLAALAYAALNPKTLAFVLAGVLAIIEGSLGVRVQSVALVAFVLAASISVTAPVALAVLTPDRTAAPLGHARNWLGANSPGVTAAVLAVLGAMLLYSGIVGLVE